MPSFFEKLKKGMGIETEEKVEKEEEKEEEKEGPKVPKPRKPRTLKIKAEPAETKEEKAEPEKVEIAEVKDYYPPTTLPAKGQAPEIPSKAPEKLDATHPPPFKKVEWPEPEGQLAIDVYQTETELVIQSAIAGVKPEDLDISIERDIVSIKGNRQKPFEEGGDYFTQECYWGPFSREAVLPVEVDPDRAEATMKDGILTIRIPKILREKLRRIKVRV